MEDTVDESGQISPWIKWPVIVLIGILAAAALAVIIYLVVGLAVSSEFDIRIGTQVPSS
jgi:hypothetical protein